jgi:hypothetical protein
MDTAINSLGAVSNETLRLKRGVVLKIVLKSLSLIPYQIDQHLNNVHIGQGHAPL